VIKKRSAILAGLLNFMGAGLGFLYVGRPSWAAINLLSLPLLLGFGAWIGLMFKPAGFVAVCISLLAVIVASMYLAVRIARREQAAELRAYQRWYVYFSYYVAASIFLNVVLMNRSALFGYETFRVPSRSMMETLLPGDSFVSNTWAFKRRTPRRGEVIVFLYPKDPSLKYVQRVVGLPGDTLRVQGGVVEVNGARLDEPYISPGHNHGAPFGNGRFEVPVGHYFVMGDNRDNSADSRVWGTVPQANLYGSVEFIFWSYGSDEAFQPAAFRASRIGWSIQ